jgi:hypothetical protein
MKSIEHRNTDTGPQEVKEDPMATTGTQGEQWTRSVFLYPTVFAQTKRQPEEVTHKPAN